MKLIRSFDFFTKPKEEIDSSTGVGGLFSLIGFALGLLFFIIELSSFLGTTVIREMSVDSESITRKERVNIDVTFYKTPCYMLSLIKEEEGGLPEFNIPLNKQRFSAKGDLLGFYTETHEQDPQKRLDNLKEMLDSGEYCRLFGNFTVTEIPGSFHFGFRQRFQDYMRLPDDYIKKVSLDLVVNHLSFGADTNHNIIYKKFGTQNSFSPYDNLAIPNAGPSEKISFFVKIVPNYYFFKENAKAGMLANQFSLTYQKKETMPIEQYTQAVRWGRAEVPSFKVSYEFSSITINYRRKNNSFSGFLVDTLAIAGGIFSIMGMVNSFVLTKYKHLRR